MHAHDTAHTDVHLHTNTYIHTQTQHTITHTQPTHTHNTRTTHLVDATEVEGALRHKNADRVVHKLLCDVHRLGREGCTHNNNLCLTREFRKDALDLLFKAT